MAGNRRNQAKPERRHHSEENEASDLCRLLSAPFIVSKKTGSTYCSLASMKPTVTINSRQCISFIITCRTDLFLICSFRLVGRTALNQGIFPTSAHSTYGTIFNLE
jgi:hypothetical protein